jgi:hypothetical protein
MQIQLKQAWQASNAEEPFSNVLCHRPTIREWRLGHDLMSRNN